MFRDMMPYSPLEIQRHFAGTGASFLRVEDGSNGLHGVTVLFVTRECNPHCDCSPPPDHLASTRRLTGAAGAMANVGSRTSSVTINPSVTPSINQSRSAARTTGTRRRTFQQFQASSQRLRDYFGGGGSENRNCNLRFWHAVAQWLRHYATSRKVAGSRLSL
jgi:hypothetical protein